MDAGKQIGDVRIHVAECLAFRNAVKLVTECYSKGLSVRVIFSWWLILSMTEHLCRKEIINHVDNIR